MTEAAYPHPRSLPPGAKASMRQTADIFWFPSDIKDQRPTQEFRNIVSNVLDSRQVKFTRDSIPLTEHLDQALELNGISR